MGEYRYQMGNGEPSVIDKSDVNTLFTHLSIDIDDMAIPNFFRKRPTDLERFRSLREDQNIALFTPAVPNLKGEDMDPFEPLGRAMSAYHNRVKHIPYTRLGFTPMHKDVLALADAIVVVLAEPPASGVSSARRNQDVLQSLQSQGRFGKTLLKLLQDAALSVPLLLVVCTELGMMRDRDATKQGPDAFGTVLNARSYNEKTLRDVARTIFFQA